MILEQKLVVDRISSTLMQYKNQKLITQYFLLTKNKCSLVNFLK